MTTKQFGIVAVLLIVSSLVGGLVSSLFIRQSLSAPKQQSLLVSKQEEILSAIDTLKSETHGCYVSYDETCLNGFTQQGELGTWGLCYANMLGLPCFILPPNSRCKTLWYNHENPDDYIKFIYYAQGKAVVCCK